MSEREEDKQLVLNLSAWRGSTHFQTWKVELQTECMLLQIEYIPKSAQHAFAKIQMEVDPGMVAPEVQGRRVLKTAVEDYQEADWVTEFQKSNFPMMMKAETLKGLKKLMGASTWNSKEMNFCSDEDELKQFQNDRLDEWFAWQNRLFIQMLRKALKPSKVK
eukprot:33645-Rhodomonas_salina.1